MAYKIHPMRRYRYHLTLVLVITLFVLVVPTPAHATLTNPLAVAVSTVAGGVADQMLKLVLAFLELIARLLTSVITFMGDILKSVVRLPINYGGATVYQMWKWLRDLCNMLFILVMVAISFATIFNVAISRLTSNPFYWRTALLPLIIAAATINVSLVVGQTIVWGGNHMSDLVLKAMGNGDDPGAAIFTSLEGVQAVTAGAITKATGYTIPALSTVPANQLTLVQQNALSRWVRGTVGSRQVNDDTLKILNGCLSGTNAVVSTCFDHAFLFYNDSIKSDMVYAQSTATVAANTGPTVNDVVVAQTLALVPGLSSVLQLGGLAANIAEAPPAPGDTFNQVIGAMLQVFLLLVIAVTLVSIVIFMVIRIPATWLLLAVAAPAFLASAVPTFQHRFKQWLNNMIGWAMFGPLYLMVVYIGLFVLKTQGSLTASLATSPSDLPFLSGLLGQVFFGAMAVVIFTFGAKKAFEYSFSFSPMAGHWFAATAGRLTGISEATNFGVNTVASRLGAYSGATALFEAGQARALQAKEDAATRLRGRFPGLLRSEEETLALRKAQLGVRGADEEYRKLVDSRIKGQRELVEAPYKAKLQNLENKLSTARTDEERALLRGQIEGTKKSNVQRLVGVMGSGNQEAALAAGAMLLEEGKITPQQLQALGERYRSLGPSAMAGFVKNRDALLIKGAEKQKFKEGEEAAQLAEYLALIGDPKKSLEYLNEAKKGKNKFWALEAGTQRNVIMGPDGKTPLKLDEAIAEAAPLFNANDWINAEGHYTKQGTGMPEGVVKQEYQRALLDAKKFSKMVSTAKGIQLERIKQNEDSIRSEVSNLQLEISDQKETLDKSLKQERQARQTGDDTGAQLYRTRAQEAQKQINMRQSRLQELRRKDKEQPRREEKKEKPKEEKPEKPAPEAKPKT